MADTNTQYLNLVKPEPDGSQNTWGNKLNANFDTFDALFPAQKLSVPAGGTGAGDASGARANLGIGTLALQDSSSVSVGSLITSGVVGVGAPSPTADCDIAGGVKAVSAEVGQITGVGLSASDSLGASVVNVSSEIQLSSSAQLKENSRPVIAAAAGYSTSSTDFTISSGSVINPVWATELFDTLGSSIESSQQKYIVDVPQGWYLICFVAHFYSTNFSAIGGQLIVNDTYSHYIENCVEGVTLNTNDTYWVSSGVIKCPNSTNNVKVALWNYSGQTLTVKASSSIGCKFYIVRIG
jgi:LysM repeat protein